ncbi:Oidioi.mRNA.OKI2018_I69.XSR.g14439.t1.cds [Oikopleura dioica]|uniref:Oidioi.mRNA.OKI2018_I69.XSR.g14439.t1.cds n=1 Tax=Oikopleura dioica TaxID=34765 RepID=A0ABN7SDR6_OIKDI|nr:Oidioi.mRNA.OKI2018_I69.XSR.g14439.t1.cds [Oikopleura dioica]
MLAIVDESRDNECPSLPITFNISEEEFDNLNFSELPEKSAQMQTIDHATPRPIVNRFTTLKDGLCAAKSFGRLAPVVFKARAFDIRNPELAIDRFKSFAEEVGKVGKKTAQLERRKRKCDLANAGKMPCQLLDFPTDERACQLALRAKEVYEYMSERCDLEWRQYYGNIIDELIESSENSDGSPCSDGIDEKAMLTKTRKLSKKFKKKHGYHFKEALAEAKAQLKQEREDAKVSRLALKKQREQEKHNVRVEKLKTLASNRLEAAMLEVNKKQEKLEALKIAVAAAEAGNFALLERRQTKKESNVMLLDVFGIEESEEEEEEEYQCSFPENLPFEEAHSEDRHVKLIIKAAANLVTQVERECAKISFPEFYITIRGKSTSIIM